MSWLLMLPGHQQQWYWPVLWHSLSKSLRYICIFNNSTWQWQISLFRAILISLILVLWWIYDKEKDYGICMVLISHTSTAILLYANMYLIDQILSQHTPFNHDNLVISFGGEDLGGQGFGQFLFSLCMLHLSSNGCNSNSYTDIRVTFSYNRTS